MDTEVIEMFSAFSDIYGWPFCYLLKDRPTLQKAVEFWIVELSRRGYTDRDLHFFNERFRKSPSLKIPGFQAVCSAMDKRKSGFTGP